MFFQDEVLKLVKYVKELHVFNVSATHIACLPPHFQLTIKYSEILERSSFQRGTPA